MTNDGRNELIGAVVDRQYRIDSRLALGGTGVALNATRLDDGIPVVLKALRSTFSTDPDMRRRLRREAEVSRSVHHFGLVPVLGEGKLADGSPYIAMERCHAESLASYIARMGTLSSAETAAIALRVAAILHATHRRGYVHRDVKPEHILLEPLPNGGLRVFLIDFGVCAAPTAPLDERARERGRVFGTPSYVSPEQAGGDPDVDGRADLFSLGTTMFESLTGRLPFHGQNVAVLLRRILTEDAPSVHAFVHHVDPGLAAVIRRVMSRYRENRYPTAQALAHALVPLVPDRLRVEGELAARLWTDVSALHTMSTRECAIAAA